ncbi:protoporphyrinogen oxidase [Oceanobacillus piezotolerans]|uniref:Coproporphyrinogen III oxidase n=1 Tax=Oceanobacillus piezotolerans TaxID=2448030 RepID=A0A498D5M6_9BACI|nr:protoporphyrinogen oxidase [Oceanobacillus piezotolerans]RLL45028.1 protoporphyrinogen oxidase [Oceanobacillus piezotolerans]
MNRKNIVVVGGGMSGLSAAYYLQKKINKQGLPYKVTLIEAGEKLGGRIKTLKKDGYTIELGPDSLLSRKPSIVELVDELGLNDEIIRNKTGQSYILQNNKLHPMPKGTFMGVPKEVGPLLTSKLVSVKGRIRALCDYILPKAKPKEDVSIGEFMRRRFGNEVVDSQISPMLSGIHSGDIDEMSLMATYPNFYHLEQKYGSVMKGLQKTMPATQGKKKKQSMFFTFQEGLETLVLRLTVALEEDTVTLNCKVDHIEKKEKGYHLLLSNGSVLKAEAVVMATEHRAIPKVFSQFDFFKKLYDIPTTSTVNVVLAFDAKEVKNNMDGTGFQVSRKTNEYRITACTWANKKWPTTTPEGKVLLRCFAGKPSDQEIVDLSDNEIIDIVLNDLRKVMKIKGKPDFTIVTRFRNARPQYTVGHQQRVREIRESVSSQLPGVYLIGSSYDGAGIPDCVRNAEKAANDVLDFLTR